MRFSHFTAAALIVLLHAAVPLALIIWTGLRGYSSVLAWAVQSLVLVFYVAFIYLAGSWVFASFYLRFALPVLAILAIVRSAARVYGLPLFVEPRLVGWVGYVAGLAVAGAMISLVAGAVRSFSYPDAQLELAFPLRHGVYAVFEGGNGKASSLK